MTLYLDDRNTELHSAAARGHIDEVLKCLENGEKIDVVNEYGWTPLMMATRNGHIDTIKLLLGWRANATRRNSFGGTIFLMAVACGDLDVLHILLEHLLCGGVSKQSMEWASLSPLSVAIAFDHEHVFKYLLGKSFDANAANSMTGLTPLMFSAASRNETYSRCLLSVGANPTSTNKSGFTGADISLLIANPPNNLHLPAAAQPPIYLQVNHQQNASSPQFLFRQPMFPTNTTSLMPPVPSSATCPSATTTYTVNLAPNLAQTVNADAEGYAIQQFYPQFFFPSEFSPSVVPLLCPFSYPTITSPAAFVLSPNPNSLSPNMAF